MHSFVIISEELIEIRAKRRREQFKKSLLFQEMDEAGVGGWPRRASHFPQSKFNPKCK